MTTIHISDELAGEIDRLAGPEKRSAYAAERNQRDQQALGRTAKEVYAQLPNERPPALVVKVACDELPFGGW